jgi:anthraniloyl-CoA monooxygenase
MNPTVKSTMKTLIIGGGPAGLYAAILLKKSFPSWDIEVIERNPADQTFGWGVVFSDETLEFFAHADSPTHEAIAKKFIHWRDIDVYRLDSCERSSGHGFSGISRQALLEILQDRCTDLQVPLHFNREFGDLKGELASYDLVIAADGINSRVRDEFSGDFQPKIEVRKARYIWLGTDRKFEAFTFITRENEHGLFQVHAYPFSNDRGTFIVETDEETYRNAKLDQVDTAASVAYLEALFAADLHGAKLLSNRSTWINFRHVTNERWSHQHVVLIGDAAHTAHFSIGSGTKLAMEDAIALVEAISQAKPTNKQEMAHALVRYQEGRHVEVAKLQKTANTSCEWFENVKRYRKLAPIQFAAHMLTRSKRVTHENLRKRDPNFIARLDAFFAKQAGASTSTHEVPAPMFTPFRSREMTLKNRVVVSPMCQYSATDGLPDAWHLVHLGSRAVGGAGLILAEMTAISPQARITPGCTGIYNDEHVQAWRNIVDFVHQRSEAKIGLQLGHAGRKGACTRPWQGNLALGPGQGWPLVAPSALAYSEQHHRPKEANESDLESLLADYVAATKRAASAGFDCIEIHMAHGYLLASFISPFTNRRNDRYGGSIENRMRFPLAVFTAVRAAWPQEKPILVRISACDWVEGGLSDSDRLLAAIMLKDAGCDLIDSSSGQTTPEQKPDYGRMFQTKFADEIRHEVGIATMAVGAISTWDQVNTIISTGRADLCALARPHLDDPYFAMHAAAALNDGSFNWPLQYSSVDPRSATTKT